MASEFTFSVSSQTLSPRMMRAPEYSADTSLLSAVSLLDSLVSFYQNERMWVYRTRAKLQDAFTPQIITKQPDQLQQPYGPESSNGFPMDPTETQHYPDYDVASSLSPRGQTRWMRRKKGFKLRLEGIRARRIVNTQSSSQGQQDELQPREQMLEMFEKMMEARMDSCQRVNKLVRDANRANLHKR